MTPPLPEAVEEAKAWAKVCADMMRRIGRVTLDYPSDLRAFETLLSTLQAIEEEKAELLAALKPFARFNTAGFDCIMVEVVSASPDNPARRIEPIPLNDFRRASELHSRLSNGLGLQEEGGSARAGSDAHIEVRPASPLSDGEG